MALVTRSACKRRVNVVLKELSFFGGMRIVTLPAIHHSRVYVDVGLCESLSLGIVTLAAQRLNRFLEQVRLGRIVRLMALQTIFARRRMVLIVIEACL